MDHLLDRFLGLPVHPLVDHVAVALFPLALVMLLAIMVVHAWRARYGWATLTLLTVGTASVWLAKLSGEQLARHIGVPRRHQQLADILVWVAIPTWAVALVWFVLDRSAHLQARRRSASSGAIDHAARPAPSAVRGMLAGTAVLGAVASLVLVVFVGDTGARAVWGGRATTGVPTASTASSPATTTTPSSASSTPDPNATSGSSAAASSGSPTPDAASSGPGAPASASTAYTLAQVATHNTRSSCWTAIHGQVYDLTEWINQHPGGPEKILGICGTDATTAFDNQHGHDSQPQQDLQQFLIGSLA